MLLSISFVSAVKSEAAGAGFHPILYTSTISPLNTGANLISIAITSSPYLNFAQSSSPNMAGDYGIFPSSDGAQTAKSIYIYGGTGNATKPEGNIILSYTGSSIRGKVGIGKSDPSERLDVAGNVKSSGNITSLGSVTATTFYGDGSQLTGINSSLWTAITNGLYYGSSYKIYIANTASGSFSIYPGVAASTDYGKNIAIIGGEGGPANPPSIPDQGDGGNVYVYGGNGGFPGNVVLAYNGTAQVGAVAVGKSSPSYSLDVAGTVAATTFRGSGYQLTNLPWTRYTGGLYYGASSILVNDGNEPLYVHAGGTQWITSNAYYNGTSGAWQRFKSGIASAVSFSDSQIRISMAQTGVAGSAVDWSASKGINIFSDGAVYADKLCLQGCCISSWADASSCIPNTAPPSVPQNLVVVNNIRFWNSAGLHITWAPPVTPNGEITEYIVQKRIGGVWTQIYSTVTNSNFIFGNYPYEYYDWVFSYDSDHEYRVAAVNSYGQSAWTDSISVTLYCPTSCDEFTDGYPGYTCGDISVPGCEATMTPTVSCGTCNVGYICSNDPYFTCSGGGSGGGGCPSYEECYGSCDLGSAGASCSYLWGDGSECSASGCIDPASSSCSGTCTNIGSGGACNICYGTCFVEDTPVTLADGTKRAIQDLKVGDQIIGWNETTDSLMNATIKQVLIHEFTPATLKSIDKIEFSSGEILEATDNHPIYVRDKGWVDVKDLVEGDVVLRTVNGERNDVTVVAIIRDYTVAGVVYNLETTAHTYIANDIVVHNKCLLGDSLLYTKDGVKTISTLVPGDFVEGNVDGVKTFVRVTNVYKKSWIGSLEGVIISTKNGRVITATQNHEFSTEVGKYVLAESLTVGDNIIAEDGLEDEIVSIVSTDVSDEFVWDIETTAGNYYANGLLVR